MTSTNRVDDTTSWWIASLKYQTQGTIKLTKARAIASKDKHWKLFNTKTRGGKHKSTCAECSSYRASLSEPHTCHLQYSPHAHLYACTCITHVAITQTFQHKNIAWDPVSHRYLLWRSANDGRTKHHHHHQKKIAYVQLVKARPNYTYRLRLASLCTTS